MKNSMFSGRLPLPYPHDLKVRFKSYPATGQQALENERSQGLLLSKRLARNLARGSAMESRRKVDEVKRRLMTQLRSEMKQRVPQTRQSGNASGSAVSDRAA